MLIGKWIVAGYLWLSGDWFTAMILPVLGLAGSPFILILVAAAFVDWKTFTTLEQKDGSQFTLWIAVSFALTFISGWLDIVLGLLFMERADTGNAFMDAASDMVSSYGEQGLPFLTETVLGFIHLVFEAGWFGLMFLFGIRYCRS